jgi:hypothetical protein
MATEKGAVKAILRRHRDAVKSLAARVVPYFACNVAGECLPESHGPERRLAFPDTDEDIAP